MYQNEFEDIRPYYDHEINDALKRIVAVPEFKKILDFIFPDKDKDAVIENLRNINSANDFQRQFMYPLVYSIVEKTSDGFSTSGFEKLKPGTPYLFVGNHRDIVLDSALLQVKLFDFGHATSEITFGSNLMANQFIIDLGKVNRMYKVVREGNRMELFRNSQILSAYIRYSITEKKVSSWIAQRSGRTKNGSDKTETGLLKMFHISGDKDFHSSFKELNIVPLSISYEYEPCCAFKVREISSVARGIPYKKEPHEDIMSIIQGITRHKGRIHLAACTPVNDMLHMVDESLNLNDSISKLAILIDETIYNNYRLWPPNFIACDLLTGTDTFSDRYDAQEKAKFLSYIEKELSLFTAENKLERELMLKLYANPVINAGLVKNLTVIKDS